MDENSFRASSPTSVEDTFREIPDDIFNTFGEPGKTVAQTASIILEKANDKVYVLQEYNQYLSDQLFKIVNLTGKKCSDKEKMFSLFLQQSLDPPRREHWKNFCAKIGVEICSQKVSDLVYGSLLDGFLQTYSGQDIRDQLCSKITNSELLQRDRDLLTKDLNNRLLCDKLFHRIVTKWVNIRINVFIKTWMQIMRRESEGINKPGAQGEVSLHKSLH